MIKKIATLVILASAAFSQNYDVAECPVDYGAMYALADTERHNKRPIGYPFLISFNVKRDAVQMRDALKGEWLDWRTLDCKNSEQCVSDLEIVLAKGIENVDLGGYQFNYVWFKFPLATYFSVQDSFERACKRVTEIYLKYGWSWDAIANYHNMKDEFRIPYAKRLAANYQKIQQGGK